jgi:hypothetical protein
VGRQEGVGEGLVEAGVHSAATGWHAARGQGGLDLREVVAGFRRGCRDSGTRVTDGS